MSQYIWCFCSPPYSLDRERAEIWTERGHERVRYTVLPDPSISFIFIICKRMRECNGASPIGRRVNFSLPLNYCWLKTHQVLVLKRKSCLFLFGEEQRAGWMRRAKSIFAFFLIVVIISILLIKIKIWMV